MTKNSGHESVIGAIAYLLEDFLTPTTTFVTHEIQHWYNLGYNIQVYVTGTCVSADIDPAMAHLLAIAEFSRPVSVTEMVVSHATVFVTAPLKYSKTIWNLFSLTWSKPGHFLRSLRYFMEGIYLGKKMTEKGIVWVHAHFAGRAATAAWSIWNVYGIPYSVTTHAYDLFADFNNPNGVRPYSATVPGTNVRSLLKCKLDGAQTIFTISEFNRRYLTEQLSVEPEKVQLVRCGIDTSRFRREAKPENDRFLILSVGGLVEKKGHEILIQACAYLKDWGYRFRCRIIGGGPLLAKLLALRQSLNLEEYVEIPGRIHHSDLIAHFREADVFALACVKGKDGNMDGIPVAIMEAMSMEVPVVTTEISGIPELVESERMGFVIKPGDAEELAKKIRQLLDNDQLPKNMGKLAREKVLRDYDQAKNLSLLVKILSGVMNKRRVRLVRRPGVESIPETKIVGRSE